MLKLLFLLINFANADYICQIESGDIGKLKYKGATYYDAMSSTTNLCVEKRIEMFVKLRGVEPTEDRQILFIENCANANICWRQK